MKRRLGNLERQLLAYAQLRKVRELRTGDLTKPLGITAKSDQIPNRVYAYKQQVIGEPGGNLLLAVMGRYRGAV